MSAANTQVKIRQEFINEAKTVNPIELSWPIPRNSVESDHGCTSRIHFDNAGDNVTLTSQKPCLHNNKYDYSKTIGLNEVYVFFQ